jgi:hypothetical protein
MILAQAGSRRTTLKSENRAKEPSTIPSVNQETGPRARLQGGQNPWVLYPHISEKLAINGITCSLP